MSACCVYTRRRKLTEVDCKNTQESTCIIKTSNEPWGVGVNVRRSLRNQDTEKNEGANPGVLFEGVNEAEAEDRDYVGDYSDNNNANGNAHGIIRHCAENLTNNDVVDDGEPSTNDDIENGAELRAPPAKRVTRRCDCAEPELDNCQSVIPGIRVGRERTFGPKVPV